MKMIKTTNSTYRANTATSGRTPSHDGDDDDDDDDGNDCCFGYCTGAGACAPYKWGGAIMYIGWTLLLLNADGPQGTSCIGHGARLIWPLFIDISRNKGFTGPPSRLE